MGGSPEAVISGNPGTAAVFRSNSCEIGLDQRTELGGDLRALPEPEFEAAHRLVQQHAEPVDATSARAPRAAASSGVCSGT